MDSERAASSAEAIGRQWRTKPVPRRAVGARNTSYAQPYEAILASINVCTVYSSERTRISSIDSTGSTNNTAPAVLAANRYARLPENSIENKCSTLKTAETRRLHLCGPMSGKHQSRLFRKNLKILGRF